MVGRRWWSRRTRDRQPTWRCGWTGTPSTSSATGSRSPRLTTVAAPGTGARSGTRFEAPGDMAMPSIAPTLLSTLHRSGEAIRSGHLGRERGRVHSTASADLDRRVRRRHSQKPGYRSPDLAADRAQVPGSPLRRTDRPVARGSGSLSGQVGAGERPGHHLPGTANPRRRRPCDACRRVRCARRGAGRMGAPYNSAGRRAYLALGRNGRPHAAAGARLPPYDN